MATDDMFQRLDPVLAALSYEAIEMLRYFAHTSQVADSTSSESPDSSIRTFKEVANHFGCDERRVSRTFQDLEKAFVNSQKVSIFERGSKRSYVLTPAGKQFVQLLEPIAAATLDAIGAVTAAARRVPVLCAQNCLTRLGQLRDRLPRDRGVSLVPLPKRSADIDVSTLANGQDATIGLASALMSEEQQPREGVVTQWNDQIEVLPLDVSVPELLTVENLSLDDTITVRSVIDSGVTFLTPPGGVAWDFLNRNYPGWTKLRPFQHMPVPDLDYGLKCLATGAVPRSAMVVHGFNIDQYRAIDGLETVYSRPFRVDGAHKLCAVTGVFHGHHVRPQAAQAHDLIWQTALDLWSTKEQRP